MLLVLAAAVYALHHLARDIALADVWANIAALPRINVALALLCTVASYAMLTRYDWLALRYLRVSLSAVRLAVIAFTAVAVGNNVGVSALSAGAIRYRGYSAEGLAAAQIATVVGFCGVTFVLGTALLLGLALLLQTATVLHQAGLPVVVGRLAGGALLLVPAAYVAWSISGADSIELGNWRLARPSPAVALGQIAVSAADLLLVSGVLYLLLPTGAGVGFVEFLGVYLVSLGMGVASGVPGGAGVFESMMLLLLPQVPPAGLLGAMVIYRLLYYALPLVVALCLIGALEFGAVRAQAARTRALAAQWVFRIAPPAIAVAVFLTGAMLLVSGSLGALPARLAMLSDTLPLVLVESSHLVGSVVGVLLMIVARGLLDRTRAAWLITQIALLVGAVASLLGGLGFEEALVLGAVALVLWGARGTYTQPTHLLDRAFSPGWSMAVVAVLGAAAWIAMINAGQVDWGASTLWRFAFDESVPRSLRGLTAATIAVGAYGVLRLMRIAPTPGDEALDLPRIHQLLSGSRQSLANAVLLGDKRVLFNPAHDAFVMYQLSNRSCIALGDPVGNEMAVEDLIWEFRELSDRQRLRPVFYQVSERHLPLYLDSGLILEKLGEEALVPLGEFDLEDRHRADLRQARDRALRAGAVFSVVPRARYAEIAADLEAVSNHWLAASATGEKGFSMGRFDHAYLANFDTAVVRVDDRIVAFANLWPAAGHELSVDLMRFDADAPDGIMDCLFVELMLWGRARGFAQFSLGMAPLTGLERHRLAPMWHKLGTAIFRHGEMFDDFEDLRQFKARYSPVWQPRYMAGPDGLGMPGALFDTAVLIAGNMGGMPAR